jgi:Zn-dependent protease
MGFEPGQILAFVFIAYSIILHEIAHGASALWYGDPTAKHMGRLSLSPVSHIDPVGTVLFPLMQLLTTGYVFLGWARPVPVNVLNLDPRVKGEIVVSIAGVITNLLLALLFAVLLGFETLAPAQSQLREAFMWALFANVALAVFNMVPIPPLDGSHVMKYLLPQAWRAPYQRIGFFGIFILLMLIASNALDVIIFPPIRFIVGWMLEVTRLVGGLGL